MTSAVRRDPPILAFILIVLAVLLTGMIGFAGYTGVFDRHAETLFMPPRSDRPPVAAVLFSGDLGLRMGLGPKVARAIVAAGIPVLGVNSPTAFATRKTEAQVDAIVADAARSALARTGARRIVLIGQSFGADVLRVGLTAMPEELRPRIAAAILIVPGSGAYFRADPTSLAYRRRPDVGPEPARAIDWLPLTCIRGADERDSLCPALTQPNARATTLPGDHYLNHDAARLSATVLDAIAPALPRDAA